MSETNDDLPMYPRSFLDKVFRSCGQDPKGSIHRAWGLCLIFVVLLMIMSVVEMLNLRSQDGSRALMFAAVWTGLIHVVMGVLGTFVLKRFPTSFSIGFFIGILLIMANQNLIVFGTFRNYGYGSIGTNQTFAMLGLSLFAVLSFFTVLLLHFKQHIVVAPIDAKGNRANNGSDYRQFQEA